MLYLLVNEHVCPPSQKAEGLYLSLPPIRQDLTESQCPEGQLKVGIRGKEGWALAETQTLLDFAGHRLT